MDMDRDWVQYSLIGAGTIAAVLYGSWMLADMMMVLVR